jgi:CheY-like chemotaxis protein
VTHILLIEDNPIDARLIQFALNTQLTLIDDGQKALWYLRSLEAGGVDHPPTLVLLDLNLPKYDGLQVLAEFRQSVACRHLPIYLLSSTPAAEVAELAAAQGLQADGYFEKPHGLLELEQFARRIQELMDTNFLESRTAAA